jgi:hypothetical protein
MKGRIGQKLGVLAMADLRRAKGLDIPRHVGRRTRHDLNVGPGNRGVDKNSGPAIRLRSKRPRPWDKPGTAMRIRLSASFNEAPFKAWFYFEHATVSTISLLKSELCAQLPLLQDAHLQPDDIQLLLDDFELLDISPVEVLRESDLV